MRAMTLMLTVFLCLTSRTTMIDGARLAWMGGLVLNAAHRTQMLSGHLVHTINTMWRLDRLLSPLVLIDATNTE